MDSTVPLLMHSIIVPNKFKNDSIYLDKWAIKFDETS